MRNSSNDKNLTDKNRQKYDMRILKTNRSLVEALFTLVSEKKFEDITVQSICDLANIRRATFYTHFDDKYELFSFAIRYSYQSLPSYQSLYSQNRSKELYLLVINDLISFVEQNEVLIASLKQSKLIHLMLNIIANEIIDDITNIAKEYNDTDLILLSNKHLAINFYVKGVFGTIQWWVNKNKPIPKEELIDQISQLVNIK